MSRKPTGSATQAGRAGKRGRDADRASGRGRRPASDQAAGAAGKRAPESGVGVFLRTMREAQRLTREQVVALASTRSRAVSKASLSAIERGQQLPNLEALVALSRTLNFDPMEVIERAEMSAVAPVDLTGLSLDELGQRASEFFWRGQFRKALAVYDAMLERLVLAAPQDPSEATRFRATLELRRAGTLRRCGALLAAREAAERAITLSGDDPEIQSQAYAVLGETYLQSGRTRLAMDATERAVQVSSACDARIRARALNGRAQAFLHAGHPADARGVLLEALERAREVGDDRQISQIEGNIGLCEAELGNHGEATDRLGAAVEIARRRAMPTLEARWILELGRLALKTGDVAAADRYACDALDLARPLEHWLTIFRSEWLRHLVVERRTPGKPDRARMSFLRKLLPRVADHVGEREIQEFRALAKSDPSRGSGRRLR